MALTKDQKAEQRLLGEAIESDRIKRGVKGTELNIGPNMSRGDVESKKVQNQRSVLELDAPSPSERAQMMDERDMGANNAKRGAVKFDQSPEFKKGGKVSSASKRADGCAVRGKTKGRFV